MSTLRYVRFISYLFGLLPPPDLFFLRNFCKLHIEQLFGNKGTF